jgi:OmpA-OmpF porin, OOP family
MDMADSLFTSILGMLDQRGVRGVSSALGESEHSVSSGMQSSIAAVLGSIASKAGDSSALRKTLDLLPSGSGDITWSNVVESAYHSQSPLITGGKRLFSGLFGSSESTVINAVSRGSGLRSDATSTLMAMAAPLALSFLARKVRDDGLTMKTLGDILQRETPAIQGALPTGLSDVFWPRKSTAAAASPVIAQTTHMESSSRGWVMPIALAGLALGLFSLLNHARRPTPVQITPTGEASRAKPEVVEHAIPNEVDQRTLPDNVNLTYETGSARLRPESQTRLDRLAAQLVASPDVHMKVSGFTDNVGAADMNLELSQKRADTVMATLVRKGIATDRLTAKGYGEANPIAATKE